MEWREMIIFTFKNRPMFDNNDEGYPISNHEKLPIYRKAQEISTLVRTLLKGTETADLEVLEEDQEDQEFLAYLFENKKQDMISNVLMIPEKIAGASDGEFYDLRMENAAVIRKAAKELLNDASGLQLAGFKDIEYLDLLRTEVEEFRVLFAEWVKTFDQENYKIDRWGLFNPFGVNYDDPDDDNDDIPFSPDDFLDL
jgi:hypothetical protein